jgi:signal recognition particle subunit SRP54
MLLLLSIVLGCAEEYKRLRQVIVGPKGNGGLMKNMGKQMGSRQMNPNSIQQMARQIPPDMLRQLGGANGLQGLMKQMEKMGMK